MSSKSFGTALVLGVAFFTAQKTAASATSKARHHHVRHISSQAQGSYANAPYQAAPFVTDPTMYAIQHRIPVPDKTSPGFYPK